MIHVLIVHPSDCIRDRIVETFSSLADIDVVAHAATLGAVCATAEAWRSDVALVAAAVWQIEPPLPLPPCESACKWIVTEVSPAPAVVLSYIAAGAAGYLVQGASLAEWVQTVRLVHAGQAHISPAMAAALMRRIQYLSQHVWALTSDPRAASLTPREQEVLGLLHHGLSNRAIANRLGIAVGTVKNHVHRIFQKLNLQSRQDVRRSPR